MPIGRALSILSLYDLLANLIPGIAWIIVIIVLYPVDWFGLSASGTPGTFVAAVIVFGFIAGHLLQWVGSSLDRRIQKRMHDGKDLFSRTMDAIENVNKEGDEEENEDVGENNASDNSSGSPIGRITHVEESFWVLAQKQFDLPNEFPKSSKLLVLVLSYLETRPATRASRFQAIHTFHRSLWAASIVSIFSSILAMIMMGFRLVSNEWAVPLLILIGSLASSYIFWKRKNKFERTFLRYVFLDFYQDQASEKN